MKHHEADVLWSFTPQDTTSDAKWTTRKKDRPRDKQGAGKAGTHAFLRRMSCAMQ